MCDVVYCVFIVGQVKFFEFIQNVCIDVLFEYMGLVFGEIQGCCGCVDDMYQEGDFMVIEGIVFVEEMIGFLFDVCFVMEGCVFWNMENVGFCVFLDNFQCEKIMEICECKGMKFEFLQVIDYI